MKAFKNPYSRWVSIGLLIAGGSLLLFVTGFLVGSKTPPSLFAFGLIGVVIGLSISLKCRSLARKVDDVLAGRFVAHWVYEPDEWRRYLETQSSRKTEDIEGTSPEAYISRDGIFINNRCYWFVFRPHDIRHIPDPPLIQFTWKEPRRGGNSVNQVRVPVPQGKESEAREVMDLFGLSRTEEARGLIRDADPSLRAADAAIERANEVLAKPMPPSVSEPNVALETDFTTDEPIRLANSPRARSNRKMSAEQPDNPIEK